MKTLSRSHRPVAVGLLAFLVFAGAITGALAQDLGTLRKERVAVLEKALTLMTGNYREGLIEIDPIMPLRAELLHTRLELELARDQRLILLKEAVQEARKFEEMARDRVNASLVPEIHALLAKAGRLEIEIRLLEMKDSPASFAQDLETLRKKRITALEQAEKELSDRYRNGIVGIQPIMQARIDLFKARLAPSLPQAKKITLVEKAIQQIRTFEKSVQDRVEAGLAHEIDALITEAGRLGMEIQLLKMKGGSDNLAQNTEILRKNRVATLEKTVAMLTDFYCEGLLGFEQVASCQIDLLEARSETDLPRVQKIALLGEALKQARDIENLGQGRCEAGLASQRNVLTAKAGRPKIEIRLLEMKVDGDEPTKKSP